MFSAHVQYGIRPGEVTGGRARARAIYRGMGSPKIVTDPLAVICDRLDLLIR